MIAAIGEMLGDLAEILVASALFVAIASQDEVLSVAMMNPAGPVGDHPAPGSFAVITVGPHGSLRAVRVETWLAWKEFAGWVTPPALEVR